MDSADISKAKDVLARTGAVELSLQRVFPGHTRVDFPEYVEAAKQDARADLAAMMIEVIAHNTRYEIALTSKRETELEMFRGVDNLEAVTYTLKVRKL